MALPSPSLPPGDRIRYPANPLQRYEGRCRELGHKFYIYVCGSAGEMKGVIYGCLAFTLNHIKWSLY